MKQARLLWCGIVLMLPLIGSASSIEVPLKYRKHTENRQSFLPYGNLMIQPKTACPEGNWKLPELVGRQPLYALVQLGEKDRLVILDCRQATDAFYNRFYFDSDADGDLAEEKPYDGSFQGQGYYYANFPSVDTSIERGGSSLPYRFQPSCYFFPGAVQFGAALQSPLEDGMSEDELQRLQFRLSVECSYFGELSIGDKKYQVCLGDSNGNGAFNDAFSESILGPSEEPVRRIYGQGDQFYLVPADQDLTYYDGMVCGNRLFLDGQLYDVDISTPKSRMVLTPTTYTLTAVSLPYAPRKLVLYTKAGDSIMAREPGKVIRVPAGTYRLASYQLYEKDKQGDTWRIEAWASTDTSFVDIAEGLPVALAFGEPYKPVANVPSSSREVFEKGDADAVSIDFEIFGRVGEIVTDLERVSGSRTDVPMATSQGNSNLPKEPTYKIIRLDGELVAQGSFSYG